MSAPHSSTASTILDADLVTEVNRRLAAGQITAAQLKANHGADFGDVSDFEAGGGVDGYALKEAQCRFARRDYADTLHYLEIALGRDFIGLSDLVLGERS